MTEEATDVGLLPLTSEIVSSEGSGRNSTGKAATTAALSPSKDDGKILPHYLTASTSSCHDFCKYGRKNSFRSKGKRYVFPLFAPSRTTPVKEQSQVKIPSLSEGQKKSTGKQKALAHKKTGLYDKHVILEEVCSTVKTVEPGHETEIINQSILFHDKTGLSEGPEVTMCILASPSKITESFGVIESIKLGTPLEGLATCDDPETNIQETSPLLEKTEASQNSETASIKNPFKQIDLFLEPAATNQRTRNSKMLFTSVKSKVVQEVSSTVKKTISSGKSKVSNIEAPSPARRSDASARPPISGKSKGTTLKSISPPNPTTGTTRRKGESKRIKQMDLPLHVEKKTMRPLSASLLSQPSLKRISSITLRKCKITRYSSAAKNPKKVEKTELANAKIKEKTLFVVEPRSAVDQSYEAARSCPSSSSSVLSHEKKHRGSVSAISKGCQSVAKDGRANVKKATQSEDKKSWRKAVTVHPEDKDPTQQKLHFRRGKVVSPQVVNDGPRRLRFRQGRTMGDNQSGKGVAGKRTFKSKELACGDLNHPCPQAETVVLKHQDVPDKKDTQGLFNHVIEETANKLVETRKSKVQALVGAFETVISLQETKPAASV